jgi:NADPH:quinone reductase-like Zn-dependent oxidoreductase
MRAIVVHETGGPDVLQLDEVPEPQPGPGEVVVRVEAAGVNHYDLNQRAGGARTLPYVPGSDAGGQLESGERVLVSGGKGCYAELALAREENVWPLPGGLSAETAAALGVPYRTAWWAVVDLAELTRGDRLLVQAGSSGTGQAAIQIGLALGAEVYATASASKHERVRELGAEPLAYDDERLAGLEADVVFDPVGGDGFARSVDALARGGRVVTPGAVASPAVSFDVWSLVGKGARIIGTGSSPASRETLDRLIELAGEGRLAPIVDRRLPLEQAAEAHRLIEARETFGKVVLVP